MNLIFKNSIIGITWVLCLILTNPVSAELSGSAPSSQMKETEKPKPWYERFSLRGYAQLRYNGLASTNPRLLSDQGDKSIGDRNSLFIRRARLIFSGDAGPFLSFYIQPDFASSPSSGVLNFAQLRDFYADIFLEESKQFRIRAGQSKVPFGFENLQSSQNRLPFDRSDAVNSSAKDERDLGLFFYWAPTETRKLFKHLVDSGLKGSGDYGVVGIGLYNGQTANKSEANNRFHYVARATYPYEFANGQILEASVQAYTGIYTVAKGTGISGNADTTDWRVAGSLVLYPQPIGFQAEYVKGRGPELNASQTAIIEGDLEGAYALINFKWNTLFPFVRWQYYLGGRKHETNAPRQRIYETELGVEWQIIPAIELTAAYAFMDRTSSASPYLNQKGELLRLQLQWNF